MEFNVQFILLAFAPVFLIFLLVEWRYLRRHTAQFPTAQYSLADTLCNGALALMHSAADSVAAIGIMMIYHYLFGFRLFDIPNTVASILVLFVAQDFCYYWFHRTSHRVRWLWASHVVHHSSERLNFSTAFRQSFTYPISGMWVFWLPLIIIGFPPETVVAVVLLNLAFQFFIHSQTIPRLGWLEWVFNTPTHHCVHHARNPAYIDHNYAGVLIIWDRMFGTFVAPKPDMPIEYGITRQIESHNPLTLTLHEWRDMFRAAGAPGLKLGQRFKHFWAPPEWQPDSQAEAEELEASSTPAVS